MRGLYQAITRRREPRGGVERTPAFRNVRPLVEEANQQSPDPALQGGAWGEIRSRPSRIQVYSARYPYEAFMQDEFIYVNPTEYLNHASIPPGRMAAIVHRTNIRVPPHVAYGSLFEYASQPYGV